MLIRIQFVIIIIIMQHNVLLKDIIILKVNALPIEHKELRIVFTN